MNIGSRSSPRSCPAARLLTILALVLVCTNTLAQLHCNSVSIHQDTLSSRQLVRDPPFKAPKSESRGMKSRSPLTEDDARFADTRPAETYRSLGLWRCPAHDRDVRQTPREHWRPRPTRHKIFAPCSPASPHRLGSRSSVELTLNRCRAFCHGDSTCEESDNLPWLFGRSLRSPEGCTPLEVSEAKTQPGVDAFRAGVSRRWAAVATFSGRNGRAGRP